MQAVGYLYDDTTRCSCNLVNINVRYESTYDADNAQCFLTVLPNNRDLLEELNFAILATTTKKHHGLQIEEMEAMVSNFLGSSIKVHRLNSTQFIILQVDKIEAALAKAFLLEKGSFELSSVTFTLDQWTITNMSTIEKLHSKISIALTEIPAHLCTAELVRFILSPYCAMESTNPHAQTLVTSETFTCTSWTNSPSKVPKRIMAAIFAKQPEEQIMDENYHSADLRITQLLIDTTVVKTIIESKGMN